MILLADILRFVDTVGALLLAAMLLRLVYLRVRRHAWHSAPHPLKSLSYAGFLFILSARRLDGLGNPPDVWLFAVTFVLALGWFGVLAEVRIGVPGRPDDTPPGHAAGRVDI